MIKPQRDESVRFEFTLSLEQMEVLLQAKALLSHVVPDGNWAGVISYLAKKHVQKAMGKGCQTEHGNSKHIESSNASSAENSAVPLKAQISSNLIPNSTSNSISTPGFTTARKRKHIKITERRKLLQKASNCCESIDRRTKVKCQSTYQLQVDHKIPFALGGSNSASNLRVLCRTHNLYAARQWGL